MYAIQVEDQPSQLDRMKGAMQFIADYTGSERLQRFLKTGSDRTSFVFFCLSMPNEP